MGRFGTTSKDLSAGWMPTLKKTLLDHFEVLHDESQEISPHWTTAILLFCCCLQTFFISRLDVYSLDQVSINEFILQTIIILMFSVPFIVLGFTAYYSLLARLQPKTIYSRRSRSFASSFGFTIYKYLYRLHFFITEPVSSGFLISILVVSDSNFKFKESIYPSLRLLLIIPTAIGIVQSLAYILFVESVLPGDHILSASSRTNTAMINLSIRTGIATDSLLVYVSQKNFSMGILLLVLGIRTLPSMIAIYWNLHRSYFFHPYGRVVNTSSQILYLCVTTVYTSAYMLGQVSYTIKSIIIPLLLVVIGLFKIISNINQYLIHIEINSDTCSLYTVLHVAHSYLYSQTTEDADYQEDIRTLSQVSAFIDNRDEHYEAFKHAVGLVGNERDIAQVIFIMYLFEKLKLREPGRQFIITIYQAYYLKNLSLNVFYLSILLGKLKSDLKSFLQSVTLKTFIRHLEKKFEKIYTGRESFGFTGVRFYKENSLKLLNITKANDVSVDDINRFDIFESLTIIGLFEKMVIQMVHVVGVCLILYDKISTGDVESSEIHKIVHRIYVSKRKIERIFLQIENSLRNGDQKNMIHLLPYGLFMFMIENDRLKLIKMHKMHKDRGEIRSRIDLRRSREGNLIKYLDYDTMVCMLVGCMKVGLGNILYVTKNSEGVFGVLPKNLEKKNISHLMSEDLQMVHSNLLYSFVRQHDKAYLGKEKKRYLKMQEDSTFTHCSIITKLSPVVNEEISFISLIKNENCRDTFLLLNSDRRITGFSQNFKEYFPLADKLMRKKLSLLSTELDEQYVSAICHYLSKTYKLNREELSKELAKSNINIQDLHRRDKIPRDSKQDTTLDDYVNFADMNLQTYPELELDDRIVFKDNVSFDFISINNPPEGIFLKAVLRLSIDQNMLPSIQTALEGENTPTIKPARIYRLKVNEILHKDRIQQRHSMIADNNMSSSMIHSDHLYMPIVLPTSKSVRITNHSDSMKNNITKHNTKSLMRRESGLDIEKSKVHHKFSPNDVDLQSSSPDTFSVMNKVNLVINQKSRKYFVKELMSIVLVQVLVWSLGTYITVIMGSSFVGQMSTIIELRKGLNLLAFTGLHVWSTVIPSFEYILEKRQILDPNRYNYLLPNYDRNFSKEMNDSFWNARVYSHRFQAHIYSFSWEYAYRYLKYTAVYKMRYSENSDSTSTSIYSYRSYHRMVLWTLRNWRRQIEELDFNAYSLRLFTEIVGSGISEKIGSPTVLLLMDSDSQTYSDLTSRVSTISIAAILFSLIIANTIIFIIYIISKKITVIYSAFDRLYDYEIAYQKRALKDLITTLNMSVTDGVYFYLEYMDRTSRRSVDENSDHMNKHRGLKGRRVGKGWFNTCFGMLIYVLMKFILMEAFNTTAYIILNKVIDQSNKKLDSMVLSRASVTGASGVNSIIYRIYALSIYKSGLGLKYLNETSTINAIKTSQLNLDNLYSSLDKFTASTVRRQDYSESIGFESLNRQDSCRYMDLSIYNLTLYECRRLANNNMSKSPLEVFRWIRFTIANIIYMLDNSTPANILDILSTKEFIALQVVRRGMTINYSDSFNTELYDRLTQYHKKTGDLIYSILPWYLLISILMAVLSNVLGMRHMRKQIRISVSTLLLLPTDSQSNNPYVAALINTLYKY